MIAAFVALVSIAVPSGEIVRSEFGIPHVFSSSLEGAFFFAGYADAEDRMWQMELSRRSARGKLAQILGTRSVASDTDAIRFGYTDAEYKAQYDKLGTRSKTMLDSYARGVNAFIEKGSLPTQFADRKPDPWTPTDSLAIGVNLARLFGRGGAGEIRNLLLFTYLKDKVGKDALSAVNDIAWFNDLRAITTCSKKDDVLKSSPFLLPTAAESEAHVASLPKANLIELLPGIRIAELSEMKEMSAQLALPNKTGSYAMVVSPTKSAIGVPILLSAPQMGFQTPSIIRQISIDCPEYQAVGMSLPGVPGVLIGHSPNIAWGMTSGVADTDDIFFVKLNPKDSSEYEFKGAWKKFEIAETPIEVKGAASVMGRREMSEYGPVVIKSVGTGVAYVRKSSLWMKETEAIEHVSELPNCRTIGDVKELAGKLNVSFNLFAATNKGDIGWFFCGAVPIRAKGVDYRFPTPADGKHDWQGMVPPNRMPFAINPSSGYLTNWNNKPVDWWPNMDTPVWGSIFRNEILDETLRRNELFSAQDFEALARRLATNKSEPKHFVSQLTPCSTSNLSSNEIKAKKYLDNWKYDFFEGSVAPTIYDAFFASLQDEVCIPKLGNFLSPDNLKLVAQATFIDNALNKRTKIDYLAGRTKETVLLSAFSKAIAKLVAQRGPDVSTWRYRAGRIAFSGMQPVLYGDRGTYIQIVELWTDPRGRFIAPPGVSENSNSANFSDQRDLANNWSFIPMIWKRSDLPQ